MPSSAAKFITTPQINLNTSTQTSETLPGWIFSSLNAGLENIADRVIKTVENVTTKTAKYIPHFLTFPENLIPKIVYKTLAPPLAKSTEKWGKREPISFFRPFQYIDGCSIKLARNIWTRVNPVHVLVKSIEAFSQKVEQLAKTNLILKPDVKISIETIVAKAKQEYEDAMTQYIQENHIQGAVENTLKVSARHTIVWLERATLVYMIPYVGGTSWYICSWLPFSLAFFTAFSTFPWTYVLSEELAGSENIDIYAVPDANQQISQIKGNLSDMVKKNCKSYENFFRELEKLDMNTSIKKELNNNPFKAARTETPAAESEKKATVKESKQEKKDNTASPKEMEQKRVASTSNHGRQGYVSWGDDEPELTKSERKKLNAELEDLGKKYERVKQKHEEKVIKLKEQSKENQDLQTSYKNLEKDFKDLEQKNKDILKANKKLYAAVEHLNPDFEPTTPQKTTPPFLISSAGPVASADSGNRVEEVHDDEKKEPSLPAPTSSNKEEEDDKKPLESPSSTKADRKWWHIGIGRSSPKTPTSPTVDTPKPKKTLTPPSSDDEKK